MSRKKKERGKARKKKSEGAAESPGAPDLPPDGVEEAAEMSNDSGAPAPETESPDLEQQVEELKDKLQRKTAEFINFQKRMRREMEEVRRFAAKPLAFDLLTVADSFERALLADDEGNEKNRDGFIEGFRMIFTQMISAMEKSGIKPIEALDQPFDPNRHEAIMEEENSELPDRTVIDELVKGYMLHDRLLRPTTVRVSRQPGESTEEEELNEEPTEENDEIESNQEQSPGN